MDNDVVVDPQTTQAVQTPAPVDPKPQTSKSQDDSMMYIKELRNEAAEYRVKAKSLETKVSKLESIESEYTSLLEKYKTLENERRDELLNQLPKDKQTEFKDLNLDVLTKIVKNFGVSTVTTSPGTIPIQDGDTVKSFEQMTEEELGELLINNPSAYNKLQKEFFNKKYGGL